MVCLVAQHDNLQSACYDLSHIDSHSLRSGRAVHLKLIGFNDGIIKKLGRWSSKTYAKYIQPHIARMAETLQVRDYLALLYTP